jgi:hypothetical protein
MNTSISIIYLTLNSSIDERISIGLVAFQDDNLIFHYSTDKLKRAKGLLPSESWDFLNDYLKNINNTITKFRKRLIDSKSSLLKLKTSDFKTFRLSYFDYLSRYSNNMVKFSKPIKTSIILNEEAFNSLFEELIYQKEKSLSNQKFENLEQNKKLLFAKIKNRVNVNVELKELQIPELKIPKSLRPKKIDFLGKNGNYTGGKFFNFNNDENHLINSINQYTSFVLGFEKKGHFFLIGNKPKNDNAQQLNIWNELQNQEICDFVDITNMKLIEDYIEKNKVAPLF